MSTENLENQQNNFNISDDLAIRMQNNVMPSNDEFEKFLLETIQKNENYPENIREYTELKADSSSVSKIIIILFEL